MMRFCRSLTIVVGVSLLGACASTIPAERVSVASAPERARNVILFIGDGMGVSTVTAARIYAGQKQGHTGEENVLSFEKFPQTAMVKTYNTNAQVPDSAGTATAINSGAKTRMGVIGIGPEARRGQCREALAHPLSLVAEEAHKGGRAIGIVTTTRLTHATPAAVFAHSSDRDWEADGDIPAAQRGQGCRDIAAQLVDFPFAVALGGGHEKFVGKVRGGDRLDGATDLTGRWGAEHGGSYVASADALARAPHDRPVLGIFSPSHMTYMAERTNQSTEPTLTQMTAEAIDRLNQNPQGYYLMVEGGRIDHAHHENRAGYALEETIEFARAVQYAVEHTDPANTLILVTADHSHVFTMAGYPRRGNPILGLVVPPSGDDDEHGGAETDGAHAMARDGQPYTTLGYANGPAAVKGPRGRPETGIQAHQHSLVPLGSETHGGEDVTLYATGPGSNAVHGVIEQNRIGAIMRAALGLSGE
ncbi:MAG: alkaline phosphatase [Sphingomonadaceae bacterium]